MCEALFKINLADKISVNLELSPGDTVAVQRDLRIRRTAAGYALVEWPARASGAASSGARDARRRRAFGIVPLALCVL